MALQQLRFFACVMVVITAGSHSQNLEAAVQGLLPAKGTQGASSQSSNDGVIGRLCRAAGYNENRKSHNIFCSVISYKITRYRLIETYEISDI